MHTKFHKDWFRHSKINKGGFTDTQHDDIINLPLFFSEQGNWAKTVFVAAV
jgi:hypothetical protein